MNDESDMQEQELSETSPAEEPTPEPVSEPVPEPEPKPRSSRSRRGPATVSVRNLTRRSLTLFDTEGNGVYVGPRATITLEERLVGPEFHRRAKRNEITLS